MTTNNNIYNNYLVKKPWGEEYTIYKNKSKIAITLVKIKPGKSTSLHCHPNKKTGFIILSGNPIVQIGIHKNNLKTKSLSILVIRPGLFHSIKNPKKSKKNVYALEFETPYNKNDLVRFKDKYGRKKKGYENIKFFEKLKPDTLIFKNKKHKTNYKLLNKKISIETIKNYAQISNYKDRSVSAILDGKIINHQKKTVIKFGEIIKTSTLKALAKEFAIQNKLIVLNIY